MKNKIIISAFVLGFSFAPISAFADSVTTTQGGSPIYSCPEGQQLIDTDKCSIPEHYENQATTQPAQTRIVGGFDEIYFLDSTLPKPEVYNPTYPYQDILQCRTTGQYPIWKTNVALGYSGRGGGYDYYYCPAGGGTPEQYCQDGFTLENNNCVGLSPVLIPSTTVSASVSGSNGGSLVASVAGFLTPVWNFLVNKLIPAITLLVILGIGVRLSIKAVRKYSKVA